MIDNVLTILGITEPTELVKKQLDMIIKMTSQRLLMMLNTTNIPEDLCYIIAEVSVKRYNRLGSEGLTSHNVEGESLSWSDHDFDEYLDDIQAWMEMHDEKSGRREIVFL